DPGGTLCIPVPSLHRAVRPTQGAARVPPIIPRWEWRAFGSDFPGVEAKVGDQLKKPPHESDELYFLSKTGENVKVRDDLMDIKALREVNGDGLEQWIPGMKASFPLPAAEVKKVLEALKVDAPALRRAEYSLADFSADFAGPNGPIRPVKVHKTRRRFTIGKC